MQFYEVVVGSIRAHLRRALALSIEPHCICLHCTNIILRRTFLSNLIDIYIYIYIFYVRKCQSDSDLAVKKDLWQNANM